MTKLIRANSHRADLVYCWMRAYGAGWIMEKIPALIKCGNRPDGIWVKPSGERIAIEVERGVKWSGHYCVKAGEFTVMMNYGEIEGVLYLSPDERLSERVMRAYERSGAENLGRYSFETYEGQWV